MSSIRWHKLAIFLISAFGVIAYHNTIHHPFFFDDWIIIVGNSNIRDFSSTFQSAGGINHWRPVVNWSLALNYAISGLNVWSYHAFNVVIHIFNAILLFKVVHFFVRMHLTRYQAHTAGLALIIALVWLLHPLQTQSVNYLIQRCESMMGFFFLLTFYCSMRAFASTKPLWYVVAIVACALGMGTKEVMVTAPFVILLYDVLFVSLSFQAAFRKHGLFYIALCATGFWLLFLMVRHPMTGVSAGLHHGNASPLQYLMTQPAVLLHYLKLSFWPANLCFDYWWPAVRSIQEVNPWHLFGVLSLLGITLYGLIIKSGWSFLGIWFFLILSPTSSILPISDAAAEHRMYLPLAAIVALCALLLHEIWYGKMRNWRLSDNTRRWCVFIGAGVFVTTLTITTLNRNNAYASEILLWQDAVKKWPGNPRSHSHLGHALRIAGDYEGAERHYRESIRLMPEYLISEMLLADLLITQSRLDEAEAIYKKLMQIPGKEAVAYNGLGKIMKRKKDYVKALMYYQAAHDINPDMVAPLINMAVIHAEQNEFKAAEEKFLKAKQRNPTNHMVYYNLGVLKRRQGNSEEAVRNYHEAIRHFPNFSEAYNELGEVMAAQGKYDEAKTYFEKAIRINPSYQQAKENLARLI